MTKVRVVPDTNVIISSIFWKGNEHTFIRKGFEGAYILVLSSEIIEEVVRNLRKKFKFPEDKIKEVVALLYYFCHIIEPKIKLRVVKKDPSDDKIIETAVDGKADFIVTGDEVILKIRNYGNIKILKVREFLNIVDR
ncbi:MAG: putative toxin-antitoxin system toxin component, PIN family [Nanoarchaeota archaeon]